MKRGEHHTAYQLFMMTLCLFALGALAVETLVTVSPGTRGILEVADAGICVLFFIDFLFSFAIAPSRWRYLYTWGWIDLLSSIPVLTPLRLGRAARVMRIFRVLRGVRATKILASLLLNRRAESAFLAVTLLSILLLVFSSIAILHFEKEAGSANIQSADDALWWALETITTVGYGDQYPVTAEGKVIAAILMIAGVGLFGTFSGFVASWFLAPRSKQQGEDLGTLQAEVREIRTLIEDIRDRNASG